ncbi:nickel/cobalt transporter [Breznakiella homolactica]|uniref:Nickel/cobalt efflux system n=1 Tax=Breznakiella homolactica TaxID=2798577 RepID=A0A7T8BBR4_9SPIR|nr:hypothetical protein [Breznakiella homolactica]QQO10340.1 hypothetical protein JFL75_05320 [Breznakiella homolactica]
MRILRTILFFVFFLFTCLTVSANPFLGGGDDEAPAPAPVLSRGANQRLIDAQFIFREKIAEALSAFKDGRSPFMVVAVLLGAFIYGVLHAAGPGHRKAVVFSLFLTRNAKPWEPAAAGFLSAAVHAGTGLAIVGIFSLISGAAARISAVDNASLYMEGFSFAALGLAGLVLGTIKAISMVRRRNNPGGSCVFHGTGTPENNVNSGSRERSIYMVAAVSSFVPCPGATMVLLLALYLNLTFIGVFGVLAMSVGMGIVISAAGYLAYFGREGLFMRFKSRGRTIGTLADFLELFSYMFMVIFAFYTAAPFLISLF